MLFQKRFQKRSSAGFTLLEMLVTIAIAGVLAAIAAPSWMGMINTRRLNTANDQVMQVLRQAQNQAIKSRSTQVVSFTGTPPTVPPTVTSQGLAQRIGDPNFNGLNIAVTNGTNDNCPTGSIGCVVFDDRGNVEDDNNDLGDGIKITVSAPEQSRGAKRCVIVETLLGAMRTASDADCS